MLIRTARRHPTSAVLGAALIGAVSLSPRTASADDAPAPSPSATDPARIQPPVLKFDPGVTYPEQALSTHLFETRVVTLILELDRTGAVTNAEVETPQGNGFDEAAASAARKLVFEPAQRDGHATAARIKFSYTFQPPSPRLVGRVMRQGSDSPISGATVSVRDAAGIEHSALTDTAGAWSMGGLAPGPAHVSISADRHMPLASDETLNPGEETQLLLRLAPELPPNPTAAVRPSEPIEEVTVHGEKPPREVIKRTMSKEEIGQIPGTNGDALTSLQNMPGVARPPPFRGALIVRGSAPEDTHVFVDGTNIPLVYHFGAFSSVVPTEVLEKIDFYPGNFSAQYGRGMGGVVDVGIRSPKRDGLHAMGQADLIDTRLLVEGPIGKTGWNFLLAGRRSWFDVWLTPLLKGSGIGITTAPRYYDYQAMLQKDLSARQSFRLLFFGSNDDLAILNQSPSASDPSFGGALSAHTAFWRLQARYENKFTDTTALRATVAYGVDALKVGLPVRFQSTTEHPLSNRLELSQKLGTGITANFGADFTMESYDLRVRRAPPRRPGQPDLGTTDTPVESSSSGTLVLPGVYTEWEIVPRSGTRIVPGLRGDYDSVIKRWDFAPRLNVRQDLTRGFPRTTLKGGVGLYYQPPTPLQTDARYGQTRLRSNRSVHYDVGVDQDLTPQVDLSVDAFYKQFDKLVVPGGGNSGTGHAYGVECMLRYKSDERFFGWISYTLSRSVRQDLPGDPLRLFQYDQTHLLTMIASYKLGRNWQLGGRFRLASGPLATPSSYGAFDATSGTQLTVDGYPAFGQRLPLFHQLDVRVDKTWKFPAWSLTWYLDVQNAYSNRAKEDLSYNYNYTSSTYTQGLPILPSLGLRAEF